MVKCDKCGEMARLESWTENGGIVLRCSNDHIFERKLLPHVRARAILRPHFESVKEARKRREKLRRRRQATKENEVFLDCRILYL